MSENKFSAEVTLIPLSDKITYRIKGRIFCSQTQDELPNSRTYKIDDLIWISVFGSSLLTEKFIKANQPLTKVLGLSDLGYAPCDSIQQ